MDKKNPVILQVLPALESGGVEEIVVQTAITAAEAGCRTVVASAGGRMIKPLEKRGIRHVELPLDSKNPVVMYRNYKKLKDAVLINGVDIVHAHSRAPAWSAYYAAKHTGRKFVTTFHGYYGTKGYLGLKWRYNAIMAHGHRVIAVSQFIKEHVISTYKIFRECVRLIYGGVDTAKFSPEKVVSARREELLSKWRLPESARIILLPGRGTRLKGHAYMLEALKILDRDGVYVVMAGAENARQGYIDELTAKAEELGVSDRVRFTRPVADMPAAYMLASVVANTSTTPESFGLTVIEAQAMGRVPVSFDHGGPQETIKNGVTGFLVPPCKARALADAIAKVLDMSAADYARMAAAGRQSVEKSFSLEVMAKKTLDLYRELMGDETPPSSPVSPAGYAATARASPK